MAGLGMQLALLQGEEVAIYILTGSIGVSLMIGSLAWSIGMLVNKIRGHGQQRAARANLGSTADTLTAKALDAYKELAREKLEVIKTALAMGYKDDEIEKLDARLENLIGRDKLEQILRGQDPATLASVDLLDTQLDHEITRLKQARHTK